jgi:DNA adenine methylase
MRYPGGKAKIKNLILERLKERYSPELSFMEPFFGGGSIGLNFINKMKPQRAWINDKDYALYCLWMSVMYRSELLKEMVLNFSPTVEAFYEFKEILSGPSPILNWWDEICEFGFMKLALHQISYSGLGTKSGGPLGGKNQKSSYKINCRWSPKTICKKIDKIGQILAQTSVDCTSHDFEVLIRNKDFLIFLDPPYYEVGNDLYHCGFTPEDHQRLAGLLRDTPNPWVLTYDDHPEIRNLYSWAKIEEVPMNYTINTKNGSRNKLELLITPN